MSIGVGILGFAHGHVGAYLNAWRQTPAMGVRAIAGWDHDADRLHSAVKRHDLAPAALVDELLRRDDISAVVIAAETSKHAELVEQAAAAGKAIVLQKPMAMTLAEADRIVDAVARHDARFTMAWQMRVDPQNIAMRDLIASGKLGRLFMVRRRHGLATHHFDNFGSSWHADRQLNRGMWADDAAHAIDFLLWLVGEPESVSAEIDTLHDPAVPDDHGIAIFRYADGLFAEVVSSFTCIAGENTTEIVGERGVIIQNYGDGPSCNVPRPEGGIALKWYLDDEAQWIVSDLQAPSDHSQRIGVLAQPLAEFMIGNREPIADARQARTALRMTLACYQSAAEGRRVQLINVKDIPVPTGTQQVN